MGLQKRKVRRAQGTRTSPYPVDIKQFAFDVGIDTETSIDITRINYRHADGSTYSQFYNVEECDQVIDQKIASATSNSNVFVLATTAEDLKTLAEAAPEYSIVARGVEITDSAYELNFQSSKRIYIDGENGIKFSGTASALTNFLKYPISDATQDIKVEFLGEWDTSFCSELGVNGGYSGNTFEYSAFFEKIDSAIDDNSSGYVDVDFVKTNTDYKIITSKQDTNTLFLGNKDGIGGLSITNIRRADDNVFGNCFDMNSYADNGDFLFNMIYRHDSSFEFNTSLGRLFEIDYQNFAAGNNALINNFGNHNVAIGRESLETNTSGGKCIGIGGFTLELNTIASDNIAIGHTSMQSITGDNYRNIAIGAESMRFASAGLHNSAIGYKALHNNTGNNNCCLGVQAMENNTSGFSNVGIGPASLNGNTTGYFNTALGAQALQFTNYINTTGVGAQSTVTGDNQVQLGDASTTTYAYGAVQNRSDERDKADIRDTVLGLDFINAQRVVDFKWDMREDYYETVEIVETFSEEEVVELADGTEQTMLVEWDEVVGREVIEHERDGTKKRNRYHHGVIAQEVRDCGYEFGGFQDHSINGGKDVLSIGYEEYIAPLIKAVQELSARVVELESK